MASRSSAYKISHAGKSDGQLVVNTSWWRTTAATGAEPTQADLTSLLGAIATRFVANFLPQTSVVYGYTRSDLLEVTGWTTGLAMPPPAPPRKKYLTGEQAADTTSTGAGGSVAGDALPNGVAAVIHWRTALSGRRNRGRMKFSPLGESGSTGNYLTSAQQTALSTAATAYRANYTSPVGVLATWEMIVFSTVTLFAGPSLGPARTAANAVNSHQVATLLGYQRSRKPGVGT